MEPILAQVCFSVCEMIEEVQYKGRPMSRVSYRNLDHYLYDIHILLCCSLRKQQLENSSLTAVKIIEQLQLPYQELHNLPNILQRLINKLVTNRIMVLDHRTIGQTLIAIEIINYADSTIWYLGGLIGILGRYSWRT